MRLPSPDAYRSAIQHPDFAFSGNRELAQTTPVNRHGIPITYSGNFTATFHLRSGTRDWAVRCYTREISFVTERYDAITRFLESLPDPALAMARLVPKGIVVGGDRYDIIQMEWITGDLLNDHVDSLIDDGETSKLAELADAVLDVGLRLEQLGIAHGDIQHGNVLIDTSGKVRLVDYDDMFLPALAHLGFPSGIGQENYQHPGRESRHYDGKLDRFPFISIYVMLRALAVNPKLREQGDDDCLLFRKADFLKPYESELFGELDSVQRIKELVDRFASICVGEYADIPSLTEFIDGRFRYARFAPNVSGKHAVGFPDAKPIPVRSVPLSPPPATRRAPPPRRRLIVTILGGASFFVIVLAFLGLLGHRSPHPVASHENVRPHAPRSHTVARAPTPPNASHRRTPQVTSVPRSKAAPRAATSPPAPPRAATHAPSTVAAKAAPKRVREATPNATSRPAPRRTTSPAAATVAAAKEAPNSARAAASVAEPEPRNACSKPDAPAHIVSLAAPELSSEKRTASTGKSVIVSVHIGANGSVTDASVKDSAGDVTLDFVALGVARQSSYAPAEERCTTAAGTVDVTVTY